MPSVWMGKRIRVGIALDLEKEVAEVDRNPDIVRPGGESCCRRWVGGCASG